MRPKHSKAIPLFALRAVTILSFAAVAAFGQQQVNLTAGPASVTLPDGTAVPMWGYSCGTGVTGSTATCAKLNSAAAGWSPVVITLPSGSDLRINLKNNLSFTAGAGTNTVPTSLVIVGQLGGGLGTTAKSVAGPDHTGAQATVTWPIVGDAGNPGTPPVQGQRVQSFSTEVAAGATTALTWTAPRPGTYLIESGTHPSIQGPMGLYGILVVTTAPAGTTAGTAYPGVTYNAEVPMLLSEIDPVQNNSVQAAVSTAGFSETAVWSGLPGDCGNPSSPTYHTCYPPAVNYTPLYYLFNGVAFNKTNPAASRFSVTPNTLVTPLTGKVLVRFVNAGLRMHVPAIVGAQTGSPAVGGFGLIAEDGNPLPGVTRVQNEVFLAAGKTYDVMINAPAAPASGAPAALPVYDRQLSLSGNAISRDAGMLAYIGINGGATGATLPAAATATANPDTYQVVAGQTLTVSDPAKGLLANDINVYGAKVSGTAPAGLTLNANGTFTYTGAPPTSFNYCGNGATSGAACSTVAINACTGSCLEGGSGIHVNPITYTSKIATALSVKSPGILSVDSDGAGYPLTVNVASVAPASGLTLSVDKSGAFNASVTTPGTYTFTYKAQNSQGTLSAAAATVTLVFPQPSKLAVTVLDGTDKTTQISDYRWIIEEDRTFYVNPACTTNPPPAGCPSSASGIVPTFGTNFHTSYMPVVATGCTGPLSCEVGQTLAGNAVVCDGGNGVCRPDTSGAGRTAVLPSQVVLDPSKRYYISVLPGDAAYPFETANATKGHGMGGAPIACTPAAGAVACAATDAFPAIKVLTQPTPFPPAKLAVFVYEDDFPLNGEQDGGGGIDVLSPNEPGLGQFNITLFDDAGGTGDATGQMTYDMFNQPLSNSLAGTIDPSTGKDACPITKNSRIGSADPNQTGITGTIVTCPKYESDNVTLSPLAGQAVVANMMPGRYGVVATPGADRIARGEEWLQTNTLDGQKAHDSFLRIGEPSFFQEFGPAGYHVSIGFANPAIINARKAGVCAGTDIFITGANCVNTIKGMVTTERMSRTPDERLYGSGSRDSFSFTQCYVSFGDPDGEDFAFTKCNADGTFTLAGLPDGDWRVTTFDQWNDQLVDGLSTPVRLDHTKSTTVDMGEIAANQWQANIYTKSFIDLNKDGVAQDGEPGLALVPTNIRFRDGSFSNFNNTDLQGNAGFNEVFPLFSWYVVEADTTRFKNTGTHVVYDAGGPADGSAACLAGGTAPCGSSTIGAFMANTAEAVPVPASLRVPGAVYCANADCTGSSIATGPIVGGSSGLGGSTGRIDPPWVLTEGWQGFSGQNSFLEFGKTPFVPGENGGIVGHVVYASTRPFDDPQLLLQTSWEPLVPNVTINLYKEGTGSDGSMTLTLVDTTKTSSFDDWAQGFRSDGNPNMSCPGQGRDTGTSADLFFFSLYNQPMYLDAYNNAHSGTPLHTMPLNSQFKCYDGMHNWNQLQPAPYDGKYVFPSVTALDPTTGKPAGTNCTGCTTNPDSSDKYRFGTPMLPAGKYVVEVVVPPGYELVKEEDKNILIGDNYIAPVTVQFPNLATAVYIMPDQAEVAAASNANNPQNSTQNLGRAESLSSHEGDTGSVESFWPCVGQARVVPDFISLYPQSAEVAPFAGATRNLCDRKEVILDDQSSVLAKFYVFTPTHAAAHFTGVITDDFTSEFDPFSPQFGEKFAPADLPVSIKDWTGTEIQRVYADHWGSYDGLTYSTWEVNPPNPTGYAPTMMITCMNDPGTGPSPDPLYNPAYSNFCYEIPFMPGQTQYMDTPVTPTAAFAGAGYNNVDCAYPTLTPAIKEVDGDGVGPWVSASGHALTITALGDQVVPNNAYSGPSATTAPYNQKTITRHYGFGGTAGTVALVGSDGVPHPLTGVGWSDTTITGTVPAIPSNVSTCPIQQQAQYGGSAAQCAQLVITTATGLTSIDTVTVTIGGKAPTHVPATGSIQSALDAAAPGDLIIVDPTCTTTAGPVACTTPGAAKTSSAHTEMLLMWKPVRLQGVGAVSSIINANTHPAGKMDVWRRQVNCLFGLAIDGAPFTTGGGISSNGAPNPFDPTGGFSCPGTGWNYFTGQPLGTGASQVGNPQVDRLPLEATVGWDANLNGNLAELLQEPSLMGALEGAAITVLSKGVDFHRQDPFAASLLAGFPTGTTLLTSNNCSTSRTNATNPFPSNFQCNPSSIDGLTITNSSQGGGGIFVHAWGHNLQIANNRVVNNSGTLSGGINVGQGEFPPAYLGGPVAGALNAAPGSCQSSSVENLQLPYCHNLQVNVHNNDIALNASTGDELFSATPAGAGAVSFCTGSDYYKFNYNWVCGNLSTGDGGGVGHIGFSYNGDIEHNQILFNQSTNPTIATNGGGILIMGAPDVDPPCSALNDSDCVGPVALIGPSDGTGPGLTINANLIMGNAAESGSGGGLRLQNVNGSEVVSFPTTPSRWYSVNVTNNIITNNVAGWDGAGISLQDALAVNIINNTVESNDTTGSSGVLFNTLGAPLASSTGCPVNPATGLPPSPCVTASLPQPAGLVSVQNSAVLVANLPSTGVTCPAGHGTGGTGQGNLHNASCLLYSVPLLANDVFWQNRTFHIAVGALGNNTLNQQNVVTLQNGLSSTPVASQTSTGFCAANSNYWDLGVRGDTGPANHSGGLLAPTYSVLSTLGGAADYAAAALHNTGAVPTVLSQYCNGSRIPPEFGGTGYQVPPGISDATVPNPLFNLTPAATVDEGNNWINIAWGPLSTRNPTDTTTLGNYSPAAGSSVINYIPASATTNYNEAPNNDFFGNPRKNGAVDAGAVEFQGAGTTAIAAVTPTSLAFGNVVVNSTSVARTLTLTNSGGGALTGILITPTASFSRPAGTAGGTCGTTLAATLSCTINVVFSPTATGAISGSLTIAANVAVTGSPVTLSGTGVAAPALPTLTVLDNFNRANANTLGANWAQLTVLGLAGIRVNTNQASAALLGNAEWTAAFGAKQGAAFTITNTTLTNDALLLDASTGVNLLGVPNSLIRVQYTGGAVNVATTINGGGAYTTAGTLTGTFANGDVITAVVDGTAAVAAPTVYVWKTTGIVTTFVGAVQITPNALWQGGGRIGIALPTGATVDNFAGGTVP